MLRLKTIFNILLIFYTIKEMKDDLPIWAKILLGLAYVIGAGIAAGIAIMILMYL